MKKIILPIFLFWMVEISQLCASQDDTNNEKIVIAFAADENWKEGLGLGNQFMLLALAYNFAQKIGGAKLLVFHNLECKDENDFKDVSKRCFGLHKFGVRFPLIRNFEQFIQPYDKNQIKVIEDFKEFDQLNEHFQKFKVFLVKLIFKNQLSNYVDKHKNVLKNMFVYQPKLTTAAEQILTQIKDTESVSMHIRRGDLVKLGWDLPLYFYVRAAYIIFSKKPNVQYYIFSDDIEGVQDYFKKTDRIQQDLSKYKLNSTQVQAFQKKLLSSIYVTKKIKHSLEEFYLMSKCKHNIVPRSTYSWWAAYLNENPNKIVMFPKIKVHEKYDKNFPDTPPSESWLKID